METRDVKLRVELEVAGAPVGGLGTPQPSNPAGPSLPGAPAPDAGAGQGSAPPVVSGAPARPAPDERHRDMDIDRRVDAAVDRRVGPTVGGTALGLASAARGGTLSSQVTDTISSFAAAVPIVPAAGIFRSALLAERYGPAVAAGVEEVLPTGMKPAATALRKGLEGFSRAIASGRAALDAGGETIDATAEAAGAMAMLTGKVNTGFLSRYAVAQYSVTRQMMELEQFRRIYGMEKMGQAAGGVVGDLAERLRAGIAGSVGK